MSSDFPSRNPGRLRLRLNRAFSSSDTPQNPKLSRPAVLSLPPKTRYASSPHLVTDLAQNEPDSFYVVGPRTPTRLANNRVDELRQADDKSQDRRLPEQKIRRSVSLSALSLISAMKLKQQSQKQEIPERRLSRRLSIPKLIRKVKAIFSHSHQAPHQPHKLSEELPVAILENEQDADPELDKKWICWPNDPDHRDTESQKPNLTEKSSLERLLHTSSTSSPLSADSFITSISPTPSQSTIFKPSDISFDSHFSVPAFRVLSDPTSSSDSELHVEFRRSESIRRDPASPRRSESMRRESASLRRESLTMRRDSESLIFQQPTPLRTASLIRKEYSNPVNNTRWNVGIRSEMNKSVTNSMITIDDDDESDSDTESEKTHKAETDDEDFKRVSITPSLYTVVAAAEQSDKKGAEKRKAEEYYGKSSAYSLPRRRLEIVKRELYGPGNELEIVNNMSVTALDKLENIMDKIAEFDGDNK